MEKKAAAIKRRLEKDGAMDEKRRAMKRKLDEEENRAKSSSQSNNFRSPGARSPGMPPPSARKASSKEQEDKIRKENRARKEQHGYDHDQRGQDAASVAAELKEQRYALGVRSVSIKWKRKYHNFSEEELIELLKHYGDIESVSFVGSKGNAAIVVFVNADDASAAAAYGSTESLRIDVVGAKSGAAWASPATPVRKHRPSPLEHEEASNNRDSESLEEFHAKRAFERERLNQKLRDEEAGIMRDDSDEEKPTRNSKVHADVSDQDFFKQFFPIKPLTEEELEQKEQRVFEFLSRTEVASS